MGKPTPKVEVMKHLKSKDYTDAKNYAGEYESVVMIAKGQSTNTILKLHNLLILNFNFWYHTIYLKILILCRCARDMQVWNSGRLHIIIIEFTV